VVCPLESHKQPLTVSPPPPPCCHLKTTPASTGVPRAVAFTEEQLAADAENIVTTMGLRPDWPNLGVISMAYSYGFSNLVLPLLLHGIPLFWRRRPCRVVRARRIRIGSHGGRGAGAVARLAQSRGDSAQRAPGHLSGRAAAAALERDVFEEHGVKIHNFYGSTECGGITYDATATPRLDDASVGRPNAGTWRWR
jgi:long-chain acyl-CoA synthetase